MSTLEDALELDAMHASARAALEASLKKKLEELRELDEHFSRKRAHIIVEAPCEHRVAKSDLVERLAYSCGRICGIGAPWRECKFNAIKQLVSPACKHTERHDGRANSAAWSCASLLCHRSKLQFYNGSGYQLYHFATDETCILLCGECIENEEVASKFFIEQTIFERPPPGALDVTYRCDYFDRDNSHRTHISSIAWRANDWPPKPPRLAALSCSPSPSPPPMESVAEVVSAGATTAVATEEDSNDAAVAAARDDDQGSPIELDGERSAQRYDDTTLVDCRDFGHVPGKARRLHAANEDPDFEAHRSEYCQWHINLSGR